MSGRHAQGGSEDGFEVPDTRRLRLVFSDPSYAGLEVVCTLAPVKQINDAAKLRDIDKTNPTSEDADRVMQVIDAFAAAVVSWNLKRNGVAVPATADEVHSLDPTFVMQLVEAWLSGVGKVMADEAAQANAAAVDETTLPVEPL